MKSYNVFLTLMRHGKGIGCVCIKVSALSPFNAAIDAEKRVDCVYGEDVYGHIRKVEPANAWEPALAA